MKMEELLLSNFGEASSRIMVSFKKNVQIAQYQTEAVQSDSELMMEKSMSAIEREVIVNTLACTNEFAVISHMYKKGQMSKDDFMSRKAKLEDSSEAMLRKYEALTGKSRYDILGLTANANTVVKEQIVNTQDATNNEQVPVQQTVEQPVMAQQVVGQVVASQQAPVQMTMPNNAQAPVQQTVPQQAVAPQPVMTAQQAVANSMQTNINKQLGSGILGGLY